MSAIASVPLFLLQEADPLPFGPSSWGAQQWIGFGVYAALFLLFVYAVYRLARPEVPSELAAPDEDESATA